MPAENIKLYAKWAVSTYDITFVPGEGAVFAGNSTAKKNAGEAIGELEKPYMVSNEFAGWYTSPTFEEDTKVSSTTLMPENAITLYAKYIENSAKYLDIIYDEGSDSYHVQQTNQLAKDQAITNFNFPSTYNDLTHGLRDVTKIGDYIFFNWRNSNYENIVTSVTVPSTYTELPEAFLSGQNLHLTTVNLSEGLKIMKSGALRSTNKLTSIKIPSTVTYIADQVFSATGLKSITLPSGITYIGSSAFTDNKNLKDYYIPKEIINNPGFNIEPDCVNSIDS